jgi:SAM-dependent methyltransferase
LGTLENLAAAGIEDASVDVVISNCVINLSPNKDKAFSEIFRVLKPGGELFFSDIFADRRIPESVKSDPVLQGECLAGALYWEDFRRLLRDKGCLDFRTLTRSPVDIRDEALREKRGNITFTSITVRAFRLPLEDQCEDFGQVATYLGTLPGQTHAFLLDDHHRFETGKPMLVCGNTADMLSRTRYASHFKVVGEKDQHYGLFPCGPDASSVPGNNAGAPTGAACC